MDARRRWRRAEQALISHRGFVGAAALAVALVYGAVCVVCGHETAVILGIGYVVLLVTFHVGIDLASVYERLNKRA